MAAVALFSLLAPWTRSGLLATRAMILATRAMISRSLGAVELLNYVQQPGFLVSYTTLAHQSGSEAKLRVRDLVATLSLSSDHTMRELQSFFYPSEISKTRDDLPDRVSNAARGGDVHITGRLSGFVSLGMVKELLFHGASLDARDSWGRNAEDLAQTRLDPYR